MKRAAVIVLMALLPACAPPYSHETSNGLDDRPRIVSLDFCADQYVLGLVDRADIAALSSDATKSFSYLRREAEGIPQVRPRTEDILALDPDIVVRIYGGGPQISNLLSRIDVRVVQIGYANDIDDVARVVREAAYELGAVERGERIIAEMKNKLNASPSREQSQSVLYLTSKGAVAGKNTFIDSVILAAGRKNFLRKSGWSSAPLEQLVYEKPDIVATGFFETSDLVSDRWTPARHPVAKRLLENVETVDIPGAWTACSGWFAANAVHKLSTAGARP